MNKVAPISKLPSRAVQRLKSRRDEKNFTPRFTIIVITVIFELENVITGTIYMLNFLIQLDFICYEIFLFSCRMIPFDIVREIVLYYTISVLWLKRRLHYLNFACFPVQMFKMGLKRTSFLLISDHDRLQSSKICLYSLKQTHVRRDHHFSITFLEVNSQQH